MHGTLDAAVCDAVDQYALDRDRSRELFIGMLGHDLRDPLNTIVFGSRFLWETCAEEITARISSNDSDCGSSLAVATISRRPS